MNTADVKLSRTLSYILRHRPEEFDICLNPDGWAQSTEICKALKCSIADLQRIVDTDDKGRYEFRAHGTQVRAVQGHSTSQVNVTYPAVTPPPVLYHGTARSNVESILVNGIHSASRTFVHLSEDTVTAIAVGRRHGSPVVFEVDTAKVLALGHQFYFAPNGVWLCPDTIPPSCISIFVNQ